MPINASKFMLLIALLVIFVFAFAPGNWTPAWVVNHDKFSHFVVFFVLGFMLQFAFPKTRLAFHLALLVLFAVLIEFLQFRFFNRGFSTEDLLYDFFGMGLFVLMFKVFQISGMKQYIRIKIKKGMVE